jgi:hypothetical protein
LSISYVSFGIGEFVGSVFAQVGFQKSFGFGQLEMEIGQRLHPQTERLRRTYKEVSAVPAIISQEMK